jgi:hypothetical protein
MALAGKPAITLSGSCIYPGRVNIRFLPRVPSARPLGARMSNDVLGARTDGGERATKATKGMKEVKR